MCRMCEPMFYIVVSKLSGLKKKKLVSLTTLIQFSDNSGIQALATMNIVGFWTTQCCISHCQLLCFSHLSNIWKYQKSFSSFAGFCDQKHNILLRHIYFLSISLFLYSELCFSLNELMSHQDNTADLAVTRSRNPTLQQKWSSQQTLALCNVCVHWQCCNGLALLQKQMKQLFSVFYFSG